MDQNRSETTPNHQQNVHLYMHHVCNCPNQVYPTYYPTIGYRTPILPYPTTPRPYLQHYQYTHFNMGSQYSVPLTQIGSNTSIYPSTNPSPVIDILRPRSETQETNLTEPSDRIPTETQLNFDPEFILNDDFVVQSENFVKFLERSCLTAEQIAYRNRNRPCFRNIQNLCIRTRSEILKPSTTISNIHSQGIPWATKDFIYAFVRLTNCWHILKGYWENRDGNSLGKIEKELTPEFRECYLKWEKDTMQLSAHLTRVFYNLDTNLNQQTAQDSNNDLVTSQLVKIERKTTTDDLLTTTETIDQSNQTCSGDFGYKVDDFVTDDENSRRIYMQRGNYNVPMKALNNNNDVSCNTSNSPRGIEFLETAKNVHKVRDIVNDRYWSNVPVDGKKFNENGGCTVEENGGKTSETTDMEFDLASSMSVQTWLLNCDFSQSSTSEVPEKLTDFRPLCFNPDGIPPNLFDPESLATKSASFLKRNKALNKKTSLNNADNTEISSRTYRKRMNTCENRTKTLKPTTAGALEMKNGGITENGVNLMEKLLNDLKNKLMNMKIVTTSSDKEDCNPINDLEIILRNVQTHSYIYINEIVRDLRYLIKHTKFYPDPFCKIDTKTDIVDSLLNEYLSSYDFSSIQGEMNENVGPLKKSNLFGISEENQ